jgi:hypothetical protein
MLCQLICSRKSEIAKLESEREVLIQSRKELEEKRKIAASGPNSEVAKHLHALILKIDHQAERLEGDIISLKLNFTS